MEGNCAKKEYLGKRDRRLGIICGGLVVWPLLLMFINHQDLDDVCDFLIGIGGVLICVPLVIVLAISALYVKRRMPEWKDKDDQIAPIVVAFFGCALRLLLIGTVWPISVWFIGSNKIFSSSFPRPYAHIDRKSVFDALAKASSTSDISNAFAQFPTEHEGYECCKKWLKKQVKKSFTDKVRAVFIAYCFGDKKFCDLYFLGDGWVCNKKRAAQLLDMFCHVGDDPKVAAFIMRYTNSSDKAKKAYAEEIPWNKYVDNNDEVAYRFYMSLGIKTKYPDRYYRCYRKCLDTLEIGPELGLESRILPNGRYRWTLYNGWQVEEYETNLSKAVEGNDIKTIEKLLKWGCDPNQYLRLEVESPDISIRNFGDLRSEYKIFSSITFEQGVRTGVIKSNHIIKSKHIINLVSSREVFDLLVAAGMDRNPPSSISYVNGERKTSDKTDECSFS